MFAQKSRIYFMILNLLVAFAFCGDLLHAQELPPLEKYTGAIKPGTVVTKDNWDQLLPELKKLLPPSKIQWYGLGVKKGLVTMPIVERKDTMGMPKGQYDASFKNEGKAKIDPQTHALLNWEGGIPFPHPKNAWEMLWDCYTLISRHSSHDDLRFYAWFGLFDRDKYEKHFSWILQERKYFNRTDIKPLGNMEPFTKEGIAFKGTLFITEPQDVRGLIILRHKYWSMTKADDQYAYIPALKRIRRLTGSDTTDPLLGSDFITDDAEVWQQKLTPQQTVSIIGHREMLVPRYYVGWLDENPGLKPKYDRNKNGPCYPTEWEIRPLWILELKINDPKYIYSKRVLYVDAIPMENGGAPNNIYWGEQYDMAGKLWKANGFAAISQNPLGFRMLYGWMFMDCLKDHYTLMDGHSSYVVRKEFETLFPLKEAEAFTIKGLLEKAR